MKFEFYFIICYNNCINSENGPRTECKEFHMVEEAKTVQLATFWHSQTVHPPFLLINVELLENAVAVVDNDSKSVNFIHQILLVREIF